VFTVWTFLHVLTVLGLGLHADCESIASGLGQPSVLLQAIVYWQLACTVAQFWQPGVGHVPAAGVGVHVWACTTVTAPNSNAAASTVAHSAPRAQVADDVMGQRAQGHWRARCLWSHCHDNWAAFLSAPGRVGTCHQTTSVNCKVGNPKLHEQSAESTGIGSTRSPGERHCPGPALKRPCLRRALARKIGLPDQLVRDCFYFRFQSDPGLLPLCRFVSSRDIVQYYQRVHFWPRAMLIPIFVVLCLLERQLCSLLTTTRQRDDPSSRPCYCGELASSRSITGQST
jgi:hypothetical protein